LIKFWQKIVSLAKEWRFMASEPVAVGGLSSQVCRRWERRVQESGCGR